MLSRKKRLTSRQGEELSIKSHVFSIHALCSPLHKSFVKIFTMPDRNSDPDSGSHSTAKRSLPSWMSSIKNRTKAPMNQNEGSSEILPYNDKEDYIASSHSATKYNADFSKLLEGVVFVLSGFVNPERGTLRAQALEMGAEYRPDWTSGCTLLICGFSNTPKFKQVEADCGTIVSKEWISDCYKHKKLFDIERYLMHSGKPWRRCAELSQPDKRRIDSFFPLQIKDWAVDDLTKTMSWLENQDEKPPANEIRRIAAEGIITCLKDAIDSLTKNQDIKTVTNKWMFVPRIVTYLAEFEGGNCSGQLSKKELCELSLSCQGIYENEFKHLNCYAEVEKVETKGYKEPDNELDEEGFDSDQTIEMTEEEIDFACKQVGF